MTDKEQSDAKGLLRTEMSKIMERDSKLEARHAPAPNLPHFEVPKEDISLRNIDRKLNAIMDHLNIPREKD